MQFNNPQGMCGVPSALTVFDHGANGCRVFRKKEMK
tara:strand:+ start:2959 stop:3066 length:108 start_codon:yes stop_codon:yes gene_type:complete